MSVCVVLPLSGHLTQLEMCVVPLPGHLTQLEMSNTPFVWILSTSGMPVCV